MPDPSSAPGNLVIVSNRLPVHRVRDGEEMAWRRSPGGLVSALTPVLQQNAGLWIGWTGQRGAIETPEETDGIALDSVPLSRTDIANYYHGFANSTIWPLYHDAVRRPEFSATWWSTYREVNERFARAAADRAPSGATVWVQDYHFHLVPAMLRRLRPDVRIGFFLHIPFPPLELFRQLPWRTELMQGLLGADLIGFHTGDFADNAHRAARAVTGARPVAGGVEYRGRLVRMGAFPISIDFDQFDATARDPATRRRVERLRSRLGPGRKIVLGVDRLDYTKGIEQRLRAFELLLREGRVRAEECVLVQIAVPSREQVKDYADQRARIERLVGEINGRYGEIGLDAVLYRYRSVPFAELVSYYAAADVMAVTPLRDGMNLVCKEFVACHPDERGTLVLSEFAGAAKELCQATMVNPHDITGLADALEQAMRAPADAGVHALRAMRRTVQEHDVHRWARQFLGDLHRSRGARPPLLAPSVDPHGVRPRSTRAEVSSFG